MKILRTYRIYTVVAAFIFAVSLVAANPIPAHMNELAALFTSSCDRKSHVFEKDHIERFQIFYVSLLGLASAAAVYLFQQNFSRWWLARSTWQRVHTLISSYLQQILQTAASGLDTSKEMRIDLSWVIRLAAESGIGVVRLSALLDTIQAIDWIQKVGADSLTLNDLQARVSSQIAIWNAQR